MAADLEGLALLVTRPRPRGELLCTYLQAHGAKTYFFPVIAFAPPATHICSDINLNQYNCLIFISPQAVQASTALIQKQDTPLQNVKIAAIGAGTRQALKAQGIEVDITPEKDWSSEGLLAHPAMQAVQGQKIAIIQGAGGREKLAAALTARGAKVTPIIVYQRLLPQEHHPALADLLRQKQLDAIICTSGEGVKNLKTLLGNTLWPFIYSLPLIVISARMKILAEELGFLQIWVAENASDGAILALLAEKRNELWQKTGKKKSS